MSSVIPAYRFCIRLLDKGDDTYIRAQDISGLKMQMKLTKLDGAVANNAGQYIADGVTYDRLTISRALMSKGSKTALESIEALLQGLQIRRVNLAVHLLDHSGKYMQSWNVMGAYLVEWQVSGFDATANNILVEQLTFEYSRLRQV